MFASNYELIDTDIRRIEKLGDNYKKYVKENDGDWLWGIMDNNAKIITLPLFSKIDVWSSDKFVAVQDGQLKLTSSVSGGWKTSMVLFWFLANMTIWVHSKMVL